MVYVVLDEDTLQGIEDILEWQGDGGNPLARTLTRAINRCRKHCLSDEAQDALRKAMGDDDE